MRKTVRSRHNDPVKFVAYVLWLIGHTESTIAKVLCLRRKQIAGIIGRSEYKGRAFMTDAERAEKLKELEEVRFEDGVALDGGMLDRVPFVILPIGTRALVGPLRRKL